MTKGTKKKLKPSSMTSRQLNQPQWIENPSGNSAEMGEKTSSRKLLEQRRILPMYLQKGETDGSWPGRLKTIEVATLKQSVSNNKSSSAGPICPMLKSEIRLYALNRRTKSSVLSNKISNRITPKIDFLFVIRRIKNILIRIRILIRCHPRFL